MLFALIPIVWLLIASLVVVLCQAAARGDAALVATTAAQEAGTPVEQPSTCTRSGGRAFKRPGSTRATATQRAHGRTRS